MINLGYDNQEQFHVFLDKQRLTWHHSVPNLVLSLSWSKRYMSPSSKWHIAWGRSFLHDATCHRKNICTSQNSYFMMSIGVRGLNTFMTLWPCRCIKTQVQGLACLDVLLLKPLLKQGSALSEATMEFWPTIHNLVIVGFFGRYLISPQVRSITKSDWKRMKGL